VQLWQTARFYENDLIKNLFFTLRLSSAETALGHLRNASLTSAYAGYSEATRASDALLCDDPTLLCIGDESPDLIVLLLDGILSGSIPLPETRRDNSTGASAFSIRFQPSAAQMSALGQKRTCAPQKAMSALPPKATLIAYSQISAMGQ
jgi:hypothetical protein